MAQTIATSDHTGRIVNAILASLRNAGTTVAGFLSARYAEITSRLDSRIVSEIDVDRLADKLAVSARGASDGAAGQPPPIETEATGTQREVVAHFRRLQRRAQQKVVAATERLSELEDKVDLQRATSEIREIPAKCETDLVRLASKWRPDIDRAREAMARAVETLSEEGQAGSAGPAVRNSALKYSLLAVLAIFGAAAVITNLALMTVAVPADWAIAISALVVLVPFVLVREIGRLADPARQQHRVASAFGTILSVAFVLLMAVFAAAYVSATLAGGEPGVQDVLNALAGSPAVGVDVEPKGWVGAAVIVVAGMLAIGLGRNSVDTDPAKEYPSAHPANAGDPVQPIVAQMHKQYNRIIDQADRKISAEERRIRKQVRRYGRALNDARSIPAEIEEYCVVLEDACNIVLDRYRAANRQARTLDEPPSFSAHVCFRPEDDEYGTLFQSAEEKRAEFEQGLGNLGREAEAARQKLRVLNSRALAAMNASDIRTGSMHDDELI